MKILFWHVSRKDWKQESEILRSCAQIAIEALVEVVKEFEDKNHSLERENAKLHHEIKELKSRHTHKRKDTRRRALKKAQEMAKAFENIPYKGTVN